jgi:hypothetical protein
MQVTVMHIDQPVTLTADQFELFDGYEAYMSFDINRHLPEPLTLWVWGARVDVNVDGTTHCYYAKNYVPLVFSAVENFEVDMLLYRERGSFLKDDTGKIVTLKRTWGHAPVPGMHRYKFESGCIWPFSRCDFSVSCRGPVSIDLRGARLIPDPAPTDLEDPPELQGNMPAT